MNHTYCVLQKPKLKYIESIEGECTQKTITVILTIALLNYTLSAKWKFSSQPVSQWAFDLSGVTNNIHNGLVPLLNVIQLFMIELVTVVPDRPVITESGKAAFSHYLQVLIK